MGELGDALAKVGVEPGDVVLVHSDVRAFLRRGATVPSLMSDLHEAVIGRGLGGGTLLFPAFNFDWSDNSPNGYFNHRETPSRMGVLSEALRRDGFSRTYHPMYSFVLLGRTVPDLNYDYPCAFGAGSTFDTLARLHGTAPKVVVIGLPWQHSMTLVHYVEELEGVDYRFHKAFIGMYTREDGQTRRREYFATVRRTDWGVRTFVDDCEKDAIDEGIARHTWLGNTKITAVDVAPFVGWLRAKLRANPGYLHKRDGVPEQG